jgi:hypothetical protein
MRTREQHLDWCKQQAHEYLDDGDIANALASMMSDLNKHPELKNHPAMYMGGMLLIGGHMWSVDEARRFIDGFH